MVRVQSVRRARSEGVGALNFAMFASSNISIRRASLLRIPRRHLADDSSNYYGPGGLSARQIMDAVQKSRLKEAAAARQSPPPKPPPKSSISAALTEAEIEKQSSKELRRILVSNAIDVSDCFERSDLVARARTHLLKR